MKIHPTQNTATASLTDKVYHNLRMDIITGKIPGGTRLVESTLALEMKVSRTPVREALHKLALEGFLYSIPRAGYIVEEMSDRDVQDIFTTRMAIEQIAGRWALKAITPHELENLKMNLTMSTEALKNEMFQQITELDIEFHSIVYKASRSKTLYRICKDLSDHTLKFRIALIHHPGIAQKTRDDHFNIFKALVARDATLLDEAIYSHLHRAKEDIIILLERLRHEAFMSADQGIYSNIL